MRPAVLLVELDLVGGRQDADASVADEDLGVLAAYEVVVGLDDLLDVVLDEEIEGVDVLLHEAADFEELGEELELVDCALHRRGEGFGGHGEVLRFESHR